MNRQIFTGVIAAFGLIANFALVGNVRAQDGHSDHAADHGHHHAAFESDRLHVRVDGEPGPGVREIILIPGLSSSPEVWQGTVDHLAQAPRGEDWRIHRIHVQGFAGAPAEGNAEGAVAAPVAEEIARYIAENELDHPVVVGHSMGGTIGMMLAARHPDAVGKLMVVDQIPFMGAMFGGPGATVETVTPIADQMYAGWVASSAEQYLAQGTAAVTAMINTVALRAGPIADTRSSDQKVSAAAYRELIVTDLRPELANITAPTTVLYVKFNYPGMTNEMVDGIYRGSYAALPSAQLNRIDDSAHFIMLDQPAAFYAALDAFVAE